MIFQPANSLHNENSIPVVDATSEDGEHYYATVPGVTELKVGMLLVIIPNMNSGRTAYININGLGNEPILGIFLDSNTASGGNLNVDQDVVMAKNMAVPIIRYSPSGRWRALTIVGTGTP